MARWATALAGLGLVLVVAGCSGAAAPSATATPTPLALDNESSVAVTLFVNGALVQTVPPTTLANPVSGPLPPLPWAIEVRSPSGRVLLTLHVPKGAAISDTSGMGARADLACGRIDLYAGPPMLGPGFSPDPSKPCD